MHIQKVILENFKSHEHSVIAFERGTNAICGENYAGKTTIVQAVGLALFDFCAGPRAGYIREGTAVATITVDLVSARDERLYRVVRRVRRPSGGEWYVRDPELGMDVVTGAADMTRWLREHLGLAPGTDLAALFEDAVGVPQGELTTAFTERPAARQARFNALLRVEEYRIAFENLLRAVQYLKDRLSESGAAIARLEGETANLEGEEGRSKELAGVIGGLEKELTELETAEGRLEGEEAVLTAKKARMDRLDQKARRLTGWQAARKARQSAAIQRLGDAEEAAAQLAEHTTGHSAYLKAEKALCEAEARLAAREPFLQCKAKLEQQRTRLQTEHAGYIRRLRLVEAAEAEMARLQPQVERQAELEEQSLANRERLSECTANLKAAQSGQEAGAGGLCPFLKERCLNLAATGATLDGFFVGSIAALKEAQKTARTEADRLQKAVAGLGVAPHDPRTLLAVASSTAAGRAEIERQISDQEEKLTTNQLGLGTVGQQLQPFEAVETEAKQHRDTMAKNRQAHVYYLSAEKLAAELEERTRNRSAAQARLGRAMALLERRQLQAQEARQAYDPVAHAASQQELRKTRELKRAKEATLVEKRQQSVGLQKTLADLRDKAAELKRTRAAHARLEKVHAHLVLIRETIKKAGPLVNELLVRRISRDAQVIYRELIGESGAGLRWTADYEIVLSRECHERGLVPSAGSERVVAALAVRLALLQSMGDIRCAFFDEPTVHLDVTRRTKLVDQLVRLPYFHQLFVISHDESFERATDHVVRVESVDGRSQVTCT